MRSILIIDDKPAVGEAIALLLSLRDIRTLVATTPAEGLALLMSQPVDLVIQDMNFSADTTSGEEGVALFWAIRERNPDLPVILLTAWTRLESAVELVKAGAADYLAKPWDNRKLLATVEAQLELRESTRVAKLLQHGWSVRHDALASQFDLDEIVFRSDAMASVLGLACRVAKSTVPVLITGPSGSGKERIAAILHANSATPHGPFVAVNCGALPGELIEAELFGVESGAYTGAHRERQGRFEAANDGTLFLDEIGTLSLSGQVKLLRVLETGRFERLGSSRSLQSRTRIVSATNSDLKAMVKTGQFREDLYYRLNVIEVQLPTLAERRDDIIALAEHFLAGRAVLAASAREALLAYDWPGNVRELKNVIERAALLAGGADIDAALLKLPAPCVKVVRNLDEPSREAVLAALTQAQGIVSSAAVLLGLSRQALYRRMARYGLTPAEPA